MYLETTYLVQVTFVHLSVTSGQLTSYVQRQFFGSDVVGNLLKPTGDSLHQVICRGLKSENIKKK